MARTYSLVCDSCGKKQTEKTQILGCTGKRDDGMRIHVDLCMACWKSAIEHLGIVADEPGTRRSFEVIPYDKIPRT